MMTNRFYPKVLTLVLVLLFSACSSVKNDDRVTIQENVSLADEVQRGSDITIPRPNATPSTAKFAKTVGWNNDQKPGVIDGFEVTEFASDLINPRWLYILPNGDILVAEANTDGYSNMPDEMIEVFRKAALLGESANRISLFRDRDNDGVPEYRSTFVEGLHKPIGMLLLNGYFYVANTNAVLRWSYDSNATQLSGPGEKIIDLPEGGYNNHWTRNIIASPDGSKIYITCGSQTNVDVEGLDAQEPRRASIMRCNPDGSDFEIFATGLRNPLGMAFEPTTSVLWTTVNERDELGDDLVPDYMTRVRKGDFYGWPYAYWGPNRDPRHPEAPQDVIDRALKPDYALGAHTASLGLTFCTNLDWPQRFQNGAFVGQHGSWNRSTFSGYKVLFIPFQDGMPNGEAENFLTGFIADEENAEVFGRPVDVAFHPNGSLYVTDDAGNRLWRITQSQ